MIASLTGKLLSKSPTEIVLDVHGVGFSLNIPLSTFSTLGEAGSSVTLLTYLQVREDALVLFGFATEDERTMFRNLISVNGIGPRLAQNILSGISTPELRTLITGGNTAALTGIPGIGKKTAERIIIELREKMEKDTGGQEAISVRSSTPMEIRSEALEALLALGFQRVVAEKAVRAALSQDQTSDMTVEDLLKKALRLAGSK